MHLNLEGIHKDALVLYRGDNSYSEKTVRQLLSHFKLPVIAMPDIDPKGLSIAQSFPYLAGFVMPSLLELELLFKNKRYANPDLYTTQLSGSYKALNASIYPVVSNVWKIMQKYQAGIVQEYWLAEGVDLCVLEMPVKHSQA